MTGLTLAITLSTLAVMAVAVLMAVLLLMPSARRRRQHPDLAVELAARLRRTEQPQTPDAAAGPGAADTGDRPPLAPPRPPPCPTPPNASSRSILPFVEDRIPVMDYRPNRYLIL